MKPLKPNQERFHPVDRLVFVSTYFAKAKDRVSMASALRDLSPSYLSESSVRGVVAELESRGELLREGDLLGLTTDGARAARERMGKDASELWPLHRDARFVLTALGMDPDDRLARSRRSKPDQVRAMTIAVGYGLELPTERLTEGDVRAEVVTRILRAAMPEIVGREPLPIQGKATPLERVLLGGFLGIKPRSITEAWHALAAAAAGIKNRSIAALRMELVRRGLSGSPSEEAPSLELRPGDGALRNSGAQSEGFAVRVLMVAREVAAGDSRFVGRVSIASVYDRYGRFHHDAGRLPEFKTRLVDAARRREVPLERLDLPDLMSDEERSRSAASWGDDHRHLIVVESNP